MEGVLELLVPILRLLSSAVVVVLFFMFIVRPLLNYIIANHEIEQRKKWAEGLSSEINTVINSSAEFSDDRVTLPEEGVIGVDSQKISGGDSQQALNQLAVNDADKAVDMVKQWINTDSSR